MKLSITGLFYPLTTLVNKIKSLKSHFPTQNKADKWKISSPNCLCHPFFWKIIEQSTKPKLIISGREMLIHLAKYIILAKDMPVEDLKRDELAQRAAKLLETTDLWLLPTMNPDG